MGDSGDVLQGQQWDRETGTILPFTQQIENFEQGGASTALGSAATEITPNDANSSLVRTHDLTAAQGVLTALIFKFPGVVPTISLPDRLTGISVVYEKNSGNGLSIETGSGISVGSNAAMTINLTATGQGSASIIPDIQPTIIPYDKRNLPVENYFFYAAHPLTLAQLLSSLTTYAGAAVSAWPSFVPVPHTFTLKGQRLSIQANAHIQQHVSLSNDNATQVLGDGTGTAYEVGSVVKTVTIPPTIHGAITFTITGDTNPATRTFTVRAHISNTEDGGLLINWSAQDSDTGVLTGTVTASVSPTSLGATTPSAYPSSGKYLLDVNVQPSQQWDLLLVHATVFDFANA